MPEPPSPQPPDDDAWSARRALELLALAFVFPAALFLGFWLGSRVGGWLGAPRLGGLIGGLLGASAGFWELFRLVRREQPRS
jgi:hypothetical protein